MPAFNKNKGRKGSLLPPKESFGPALFNTLTVLLIPFYHQVKTSVGYILPVPKNGLERIRLAYLFLLLRHNIALCFLFGGVGGVHVTLTINLINWDRFHYYPNGLLCSHHSHIQ